MENGLRKELKLSSMIAMAAGGMIAAWMVEIKYWFELSGVGSVLSLLTCAILVLPLCFIYSEMTSMMPYAGGQNIWVGAAAFVRRRDHDEFFHAGNFRRNGVHQHRRGISGRAAGHIKADSVKAPNPLS